MQALVIFYNIPCNPNHSLKAALPRVCVPERLNRLAVSVYSDGPRCLTVQFERAFVFACVMV